LRLDPVEAPPDDEPHIVEVGYDARPSRLPSCVWTTLFEDHGLGDLAAGRGRLIDLHSFGPLRLGGMPRRPPDVPAHAILSPARRAAI